MARRTYRVYFTQAAVGKENPEPLAPHLLRLSDAHGQHLPTAHLADDGYQIRDLAKVGSVWSGVFGKLRSDAPHIVDTQDREREIDMNNGDRLLEKCHFLYRERSNIIVWQVNRTAGSLNKMQQYLNEVVGLYVALPQVMNEGKLDRILQGQLYEISYAYARPEHLEQNAPRWRQNDFDKMADIHAAHGKFLMRAARGSWLTEAAKGTVRTLLGGLGVEKLKVRLTDDSDPVELFLAPLHDSVSLNLIGRYPDSAEAYHELEQAYDRQRANIPGAN